MTTPDDLRDAELSRRYRALSPELPHPDTDAVIRAAARDAVTARPRRVRPGALYGGLAMAASVTLMVAILLPSWRSGELHEQVAVRSPAAPAVEPPATAVVEAAPAASADEASLPERSRAAIVDEVPGPALQEGRMASPSPITTLSRPADVDTDADVDAEALRRRTAPAAAPAESVPTPVASGDIVKETSTAGGAPSPATPPAGVVPAPVATSPSLARAAEEMASSEWSGPGDRTPAGDAQKALSAAVAKRERMARQQADMARPQAAPVRAEDAGALDALVRAARYRDALALLQAGAATADPALASRRDLLRQLLPDEDKALTCRTDVGPASSRRLCALLGAYQRGEAPAEDLRDAFRQALQDEGTDPAPWLQAVSRLP
jgi:hypothetical protein